MSSPSRARSAALLVSWVLAATACGGKGDPRAAKPPIATPPTGPAPRAWVVLGEGGARVSRVLADDGRCPAVDVIEGGGAEQARRALATTARAAPDEAFPGTLCEATLPATARAASISGHPLPRPPARAERIVVLGDTGCRMKEKTFQDCADPDAWPFAKIAAAAAAWRPDLVIHVGDFLYRKTPCPEGNAGCAGSPVGDRFATWDADFVTPAMPLLRAAPWVAVRGNHEGCAAGGLGYFRLLDPRPFAPACSDATEPYTVALGDLRLWVVDSVDADDVEVKPEKVGRFQRQLAQLDATPAEAGVATWLLVHRPLFGIFGAPRDPSARAAPGPAPIVPINATLQAAWAAAAPRAPELVLSGHVHLFEALSFHDEASVAKGAVARGRPPQLVAGMGGTLPDAPARTDLAGVVEQGEPVTKGLARAQHGFVTLERRGPGWEATLRDPTGRAVLTCAIAGRAMTCSP